MKASLALHGEPARSISHSWRGLWARAVVVALLGSAACGPSEPAEPCPDGCAAGEICVENQCVFLCASDNECPRSCETCQAGRCAPEPNCEPETCSRPSDCTEPPDSPACFVPDCQQGSCRYIKRAATSQCAAATCENGAFFPARTCGEDGTCPPSKAEPCHGYACNNPICRFICIPENGPDNPSSHCMNGLVCTVSNQCVGDLPNGTPCDATDTCASGHCTCTDATCSLAQCAPNPCPCGYDANSDGTCDGSLSVGARDVEDSCGDHSCNGLGACMPGACTSNGQCGDWPCVCADSQCSTKLCSPVSCFCGFNYDGDATCDGPLASGVDDATNSCGGATCNGTGGC